ncbi:hypothetical protein K466DRAFT_48939 [Polyporus arcularius HHB13444]|uniref:Uncharacterized protein n=1 Tax=Polyporus arcularius HHB13444 TaxID=1314778 RepID=A0A5C3Q638_9APHY|nr:hypothetical protein K466DRAFT_48939 [Polyporus arcularius HHB13444]
MPYSLSAPIASGLLAIALNPKAISGTGPPQCELSLHRGRCCRHNHLSHISSGSTVRAIPILSPLPPQPPEQSAHSARFCPRAPLSSNTGPPVTSLLHSRIAGRPRGSHPSRHGPSQSTSD